MKKALLLTVISLFPFICYSQSGSGTFGDPFHGSIITDVHWSAGHPDYGSTVYVGTAVDRDLVIGNGGHLTIDPGITVIFTQNSSDLLITGSGILTAEGTSSDRITFTRATGISHWGHISFETPGSGTPITGTGTFDYCIVEYGYAVSSGTLPSNAGGGIQVNANNVIIENCIFRNNYSNFGGGVTVNAGRNTIIENCIFKYNVAHEAGGGLLLWTSSTALIDNCIFENNQSDGVSSPSYSGGAIWLLNNTSRILNCTFVQNNSNRAGDAIYSYSSSNFRLINSILWGSNDQFAGSVTASTIVTCAFETTKPALAANSIIISSDNNAETGPHFTDPASSDWSISFSSPLRDAGTVPTPLVPADYLNNPRIAAYDIGAYEVQYSRWAGTSSTSWNDPANWEAGIDPANGTGDVIIPGGLTNFPVDPLNPDFTINPGKRFILDEGSRVTLNNLTNNGGILKMRENATEVSSLIMNTYTRSGYADEDIQLYISGGYTNPPTNSEGRWHYISSPVDGISTNLFTGTTLDLARWVDGIQSPGTIREGWVAYDGWAYLIDFEPDANPSTWFGYPYRFSALELGKGYNYFIEELSDTIHLSGQLNTADKIVTLSFAGDAYANGFNLLGNPFTSGLDWDYIISNPMYPYPANTSHGITFTKNNVQYYYNSGVQVPDDGYPAGVIPPMQGFFVKTINPAASINLAAAARSHTSIHPRYKGAAIIPLVRLEISENGLSDETVVRLAETAKADFDYEFDALKMFIPSSAIYTTTPGMKYAINAQPYPESSVEIPVSVVVSADGSHAITVKQLQGLENYTVELKDNSTGFTANLKTTAELTFSATKGTIDNRFILKISSSATGVEDPLSLRDKFNIYSGFGKINIQTISDEWDGKSGSISVRDIAGKIITDMTNVEFSMNSVIEIDAPVTGGIYIVDIRSGFKRHAAKIMILR